MKQTAINLASGVCCTLHANPGVMSPSNILPPPPYRARFAQTAFMVIKELGNEQGDTDSKSRP